MVTVSEFNWRDIGVTIGDAQLLTQVLGSIRTGEIIALMGPSGSGKTTLLNVLAQRGVPPKAKLSGRVYTDNFDVTSTNIKKFSSYVEQEDSLIGSLTVKETVDFSAKMLDVAHNNKELRQQRNDRVNEILLMLGLTNQANTRVGTPLQKGISGGQKRRLLVASQMITHPLVLFLDEPTSGLDSTAAHSVIQTIKNAAKQFNMMVIVSIHQPLTATFNLFDKVLFMSRGSTIYNGPVSQLVPYFDEIGCPIPDHYNPLELILDLINTDFSDASSDVDSIACAEKVEDLKAAWRRKDHLLEKQPTEQSQTSSEESYPVGLDDTPCSRSIVQCIKFHLVQTWYLIQRLWIKSRRDILAYYVRIVMYLGLAILMGTVWVRLGHDQKYIQPFINAIFYLGAFMSFMSVAYIPAYLEDYQSYKKEHLNGLYSPFAFVVSNFVIGLPFIFIISVLFSIVTYFLCNFRLSASGFFYYVMWLFLDLIAAELMTVLVLTVFPIFVVALALTAFANGLWMACGGFLMPENVLNVFYSKWLMYINYQKYVFQGMMFNQFPALNVFNCDANCHCMYTSPLQDQCKILGDAVLQAVGYYKEQKGQWAGILIAIIFVYRFLTFLVLYFRKK